MEKPENFYAINRESAIAKAQEWAKVNGALIVKLNSEPEIESNPYGFWVCTIEVIEKTEHALEGVTLDATDNINAV